MDKAYPVLCQNKLKTEIKVKIQPDCCIIKEGKGGGLPKLSLSKSEAPLPIQVISSDFAMGDIRGRGWEGKED